MAFWFVACPTSPEPEPAAGAAAGGAVAVHPALAACLSRKWAGRSYGAATRGPESSREKSRRCLEMSVGKAELQKKEL